MDLGTDLLPSDLFKTLFAGITDPVTVIDRDFRILWANDARAEADYRLRLLSGKEERMKAPRYTLADMVGRHCFERFRRLDAPCPQCPAVTAFRTGQPCVVERRIDLPGGLKAWGETRAYPIFGPRGEADYVVKLSVEITDRKRSEEQEGRRAEAMARLLRDLTGSAAEAGENGSLTRREKEVLILVARGLSNPEVGKILSISPHTVKRHLVHIFAKLGVRDRAEAVLRATRQHLV